MLTLEKIYAEYTTGSSAFIKEISSNCGFYISDDEIERIAKMAVDAADFRRIWENDDSWTDKNNGW